MKVSHATGLWFLTQIAIITVFQALLVQDLMHRHGFPYPFAITFWTRAIGFSAFLACYIVLCAYSGSVSGRAAQNNYFGNSHLLWVAVFLGVGMSGSTALWVGRVAGPWLCMEAKPWARRGVS